MSNSAPTTSALETHDSPNERDLLPKASWTMLADLCSPIPTDIYVPCMQLHAQLVAAISKPTASLLDVHQRDWIESIIKDLFNATGNCARTASLTLVPSLRALLQFFLKQEQAIWPQHSIKADFMVSSAAVMILLWHITSHVEHILHGNPSTPSVQPLEQVHANMKLRLAFLIDVWPNLVSPFVGDMLKEPASRNATIAGISRGKTGHLNSAATTFSNRLVHELLDPIAHLVKKQTPRPPFLLKLVIDKTVDVTIEHITTTAPGTSSDTLDHIASHIKAWVHETSHELRDLPSLKRLERFTQDWKRQAPVVAKA
ncbi:hypothetical protein Ae201684_010436 [Aphanomyces euteiches]|uniref:Uncharacterized protein n=1 Tax=Aphanomyces euteiches TaxID=100861 RepID=A0A6G0WY18_9STRA|nr:hypothetical protein Ae201684_010436 [Aphanomyces euteiches]KAH9138581.1 hypothetical protein AeRB84_017092 [Aphanomyces euteiches]